MDDRPDECVPGLRLHRFVQFSDALLNVESSDLWRHLPGPTLFQLPGSQPPLFISVLLHGNKNRLARRARRYCAGIARRCRAR